MVKVVVDLLLRNGTIIGNQTETRASIAVSGQRIKGVYRPGTEPVARQVVDCNGHYILPGMVDIHVHLRDLEESQKEDYATGTMAAAAGGVTTVVDMPNSRPPVLDYDILRLKIERATEQRFVNVGFYAGIPRDVSDVSPRMKPDILGFKVYPHSPLSEGVRYTSTRVADCLSLARAWGLPLLVHPNHSETKSAPATIEEFWRVHSCETEVDAIRRFLSIRERFGGHLHFCHVSCASAAEILSQRAGRRITAEITPHHLFLNREDSPTDGSTKVLPPLRTARDNEALIKFLKNNRNVCIASDHAPHRIEEKKREFIRAASGFPGLETTLPMIISAILRHRLPWQSYLEACCAVPAEIVGLRSKGKLAAGYDADIVVVARERYKIRGQRFRSRAKITPFEGLEVEARPVTTVVGGTIVFDHGEFTVDKGEIGVVPLRRHIE